MADTNERVLFKVDLDQAEAIKRSADLATQIKALTDRNKELKKAGKETSEEFITNARLATNLSNQQKELNKSIDLSIKAFESQRGSMAQLEAEAQLLTLQYRALSKEEQAAFGGQEIQRAIKAKTDELKSLEAAYGDNRRNVGNYAEAVKGLEEIMKNSTSQVGKFINAVTDARDKLKKAKEGFDVMTEGMNGFNKVLLAGAIGILILGLTALIMLFEKWTPLIDKVEQITAGLNAVLDVVVKRVMNFAGAMKSILSGDVVNGWNQLKDSISGVGDAMAEAYNEGVELKKVFQDLEDQQRGLEIANAKANAQLTQLNLQSKNRTLSERERLALIDQVSGIEKKNFEQQQKYREETLAALIREAKLKSDLNEDEILQLTAGTLAQETEYAKRGNLGDDLLVKIKDAQIAVINGESESLNLQEKISNRRDALLQAEADKRAAALKKAQDDLEKYNASLLKAIDDADKAEDARRSEILSNREKAYNESTRVLDDAFKRDQTALVNQLTAGQITQAEFDRQSLEMQKTHLEAQNIINAEFYKSNVDNELQLAQTKLAIRKKEQDDQAKINDERIKAEQKTRDTVARLAGDAMGLFGEQTIAGKAAAIAQATINTYSAATAALAPPPLGLGPIFGPLAAGLAIATGLSNVAKIEGVKIGGAAAGGGNFMTKGPTLLLVGDNPGGVERVTVDPISGTGQTYVSPSGNLVKMAGGGTLTAFGGYAERNSEVTESFDYDRMAESMGNVTIVTKVTDINRVNANVAKTATVSEL